MKSILLYAFVLMGCSSEMSGKPVGETYAATNHLQGKVEVRLLYPEEDSIFSYSTKVYSIDKYNLEIQTELINDPSFFQEDVAILGNRVVLKQQLIFRKNDSIVSKCNLPIADTKEIVRNGKPILIPNYLINSVFVSSTNKKSLFIMNANALSNGSREYVFYYSGSGEQITYIDCGRHYCDTVGNFKKLEKVYGLTKKLQLPLITVFPPEEAGEIVYPNDK